MVSVSRRAGPSHLGHLTFFQVGWRSSGLPGLSKVTSSGSVTGKSFSGTGTVPHVVAVDDRDRTAPIALARNAPVAQAIIDLALRHRTVAARVFLQPLGDLFLRRLDGHAVEEARIDHGAVAVIGDVGDDESLRILPRRAHHRRVAEPVFVDEVQVALVVRRAAEDGAGAVIHQNEIGDIDRQLPIRIERMHGLDAGVEAHLLGGVDRRLRGAHLLGLGDEGGELGIFRGGGRGQRMIGRQRHELSAEQSVRPRGEDFQLALFIRRGRRIEHEADQQPFRAADPVLLHQPDLVRPAVERVERLEQLLRIVADLEHPLVEVALLDLGARAPAAAVDHLLVGEHGLVDRIPVHLAVFARDQPRSRGSRETSSAGACNKPDRRWRSRAPSRGTVPWTGAASSSTRCCRRSRPSGAPCGRWPRSPPACRRRPSPSGAARRCPWRV